jgi:NADH dehydrogenase FAD-containing subunit
MKRLVFAGAGHAHLYSMARLGRFVRAGISVTVISPPTFWYSGMGPGLLSGLYEAEDASVDVRAMVESGGGRFLDDRAASIDADGRILLTGGGERIPFDALSLNVGSEVGELPGVARERPCAPGQAGLPAAGAAAPDLRSDPGRLLRILVAGGGPAGCEAAANALALCRRRGRRPRSGC